MNICRVALVLLALALPALTGCESTSIAIKESFGYVKREQLVDRVQEARDSQTEAKQQFESALAEFLAVTGADSGELEERYEALSDEYESSETQAAEVRERITSVERVAAALFAEWEEELDQYSSESLRSASERQLRETQSRYDGMVGVMKAAAEKMDPVLAAFKDQVLFLKHNLNARAIASLQQNVDELQSDVSRLVSEMEASIAKADAFIEEMQSGG